MPNKTLLSMLVLASLVRVDSVLAESIAVRPGVWEVRTTTSIEGMPEDVPPISRTQTHCFTENMLSGHHHLHLLSGAFGECMMLEHQEIESSGNTHALWDMRCEQPHQVVQASGDLMSLSSKHYHGNIIFMTEGKPMKGYVTFTGERLGDCSVESNK